MLGLEPASFLPFRFFVGLSFTEQPVNKTVVVAAVVFKNSLLFILPYRKKVQIHQASDSIVEVVVKVILLYYVKFHNGKTTCGYD
jgi:hypothetical protein